MVFPVMRESNKCRHNLWCRERAAAAIITNQLHREL